MTAIDPKRTAAQEAALGNRNVEKAMFCARFVLTAVILICVSASLVASAQDETRNGCSMREFEEARLVFHRAWFEEADELLQAYIAGCPDSALANAYLAVVDMLLYRDNDSRIRLALQTASVKNNTSSLFAEAVANFAGGRLEGAETLLRQYLEIQPTDRYALHFLGFTLIDQDKNGDGVRVLEDLLNSNPDYFPAKNHLAYGLLKTGDAESAVRIASEFVEADQSNPSAWDTKAQMLQSAGRNEEAIASLSRGVLLDERFAYGFRHLGMVYASVGDNDSARVAFESAINSSSQYGAPFVESVNALLAELGDD